MNYKNIDKILLDVPCSGTGTINKNPDIKIRRNANEYILFNKIQLELLNHAKNLLSKKGSIIYSTCSINEIENWNIIDKFLEKNKSFSVVNAKKYLSKTYTDKRGALKIIPHIHKLDGMFAVRLMKK